MASIQRAHQALLDRILGGEGHAPQPARKAAFDNAGASGAAAAITQKVALHAYKLTDADITAALAEGQTEDQLFELIVCAAVGQATRQHQSALAALDAAVSEV